MGHDFQLNGVLRPGAHVVELGAGCGLAGIVAARLGAAAVGFTDHDERVLCRVEENLALQSTVDPSFSTSPLPPPALTSGRAPQSSAEPSGSGPRVSTTHLAWGTLEMLPPPLVALLPPNTSGFDLVLGSDLIYSLGVVKPLLCTISGLLRNEGPALALLCGSFRLEEGTEEAIHEACMELGLRCELIADDIDDGGCRLQVFARAPAACGLPSQEGRSASNGRGSSVGTPPAATQQIPSSEPQPSKGKKIGEEAKGADPGQYFL
uniref:Calmodulin-lysine N-methyltransferase n=1 Tax=Rhizochromulina marina TaxID=1034831 RepID=A0A7S2W2P6_9STRA